MPAKPLCHKFIADALTEFNQARMKTLMLCVDGLISSNRLTLTDIARHLRGASYSKNKIKRVDRFLKNSKLHQEKIDIYQSVAKKLAYEQPYVAVAVDWSGCCNNDYHLIRASILMDGRALPIYNLVVEEKDKDSPKTNALFLEQLSNVLPAQATVYIVSDGGFLTPFYTKVRELGWHFIGRLRGGMKCRLSPSSDWKTLSQLREGATSTPKYLGEARLTKHTKTACQAHLHLFHGEQKGRVGKSRFTKDNKMYRTLAKEPWLIACSDNQLTSRQVIDLYAKRMQIEQNFRDDKSQQFGFSWRFSRTKGVERISVLCLIACLGAVILWLIGFEAERRNWHIQFQANTVKNRRVLSFLTLAKNVLYQFPQRLSKRFIKRSWESYYVACEKYAVV